MIVIWWWEIYYWLIVLATFALGTVVGDLIAFIFYLGFLVLILLFVVVMVIFGIVYWCGVIGGVIVFWVAYVLI